MSRRGTQIFGQSRFFASHAWSYKFSALVSMLDNHYSSLPGTRGGARYLPIFYWCVGVLLCGGPG